MIPPINRQEIKKRIKADLAASLKQAACEMHLAHLAEQHRELEAHRRYKAFWEYDCE